MSQRVFTPPPSAPDLKAAAKALRVNFLMGFNDEATVRVDAVDPDGRIAYFFNGNVGFDAYWSLVPPANRRTVFLSPTKMTVPPADVIVNCIVEPDAMRGALGLAEALIDQVRGVRPVEVINEPRHVTRTRRDEVAEAYGDLPGLAFPRTDRFRPARVQDVLDHVRESGLSYPVLVRPAGTQSGFRMVRLDDPAADRDLLERFAYTGGEFYVSEFRDFHSADGLYRKVRLLVIDGVVYPRHLIIDREWQIHSKSRANLMAGDAALRGEERAFFERFPESLPAGALESLRAVAADLKLDYFGVDGTVLPDGRFFVFELNAAMKGFEQDGLDVFPHLARPVQRVRDAFETMVVRRGEPLLRRAGRRPVEAPP